MKWSVKSFRHGLLALAATMSLSSSVVVAAQPALRVVEQPASAGLSLRFYGYGRDGVDRVAIPLDAPERPIDVGATDFAIEFWIKAEQADNPGRADCLSADGWITGNTIIDRDIFFAGDYGDFGVSLSDGRIAFGLSVGGGGTTLCGNTVVADGRWHHVAVTRTLNGLMRIFVDGTPDGQLTGVSGDASYRNGRTTSYPNDPYLVLGAEKHDAGAEYPSYSGLLDELRISTTIRYSDAFSPPGAPFVTDGQTAGLYHFDEGPAGACQSAVLESSGAAGGPSHGTCRYGGLPLAGPVYTADTPFVTQPPPTATHTPVPPTLPATATNTPVPPTLPATATNTPVPPTLPATATNTPVPPTLPATATNTPVPPTLPATATNTPVPPTLPATATNTPVPPTLPATATNTPVPPTLPATATNTPVPPTLPGTATNTPVPPTLPATATNTPVPPTLPATATSTPVPPTASNTPVPPTLPATATSTPIPPTVTDTPPSPTETASPTPVASPTTSMETPQPTSTPLAVTPTPSAEPLTPLPTQPSPCQAPSNRVPFGGPLPFRTFLPIVVGGC